jgi:hypothetical protein
MTMISGSNGKSLGALTCTEKTPEPEDPPQLYSADILHQWVQPVLSLFYPGTKTPISSFSTTGFHHTRGQTLENPRLVRQQNKPSQCGIFLAAGTHNKKRCF